MSAISVIYHIDKSPLLKSDLFHINEAMQHHGQDGQGLWVGEYCGLAQQLTKLTTESLDESLPYVDAHHQITLVCHCRLFNRQELYQQLHLSPHTPMTDSKLIVHAYLKWKLDFVHYLIGEFSLALWDGKLQQLICVTDHLNTRPLYYFIDNKLLAVASELPALFKLKAIPRQPNLSKIARSDFIRLQAEPGETCFAHVLFLPPASIMVQNLSGCTLKQYWQPTITEPLTFASDEAFREAFQDLFFSTIQSATRSHLPVALQLSGGLDSSAIAMMGSRVFQAQGRELIGLSNVLSPSYQGPLKDESAFIRLLNAPNLVKEAVTDEWRGPFDNLEQFESNLHTNPQHYQYRAINTAARRRQAKLILHGTLGEITSSYAGHEYLAYLCRYGHWVTLMKESYAHKKNYQRSYTRIFANMLQHLLPLPRKSSSRHQLLKHSLINKHFIAEHVPIEQLDKLTHQFLYVERMTLDPRQNAFLQLKNYLEHSSIMFSQISDAPEPALYLSNPYFDKRWIEFCLRIPNEYRFKNGYPRSIIRIGLQGMLPEKICWRITKDPFLPDYHERYNRQLSLARCALEELSKHPLVQQAIDIKQLRQHLQQTSTSNQLNTPQNFLNYLVIPRMIYLAKFLSSF